MRTKKRREGEKVLVNKIMQLHLNPYEHNNKDKTKTKTEFVIESRRCFIKNVK